MTNQIADYAAHVRSFCTWLAHIDKVDDRTAEQIGIELMKLYASSCNLSYPNDVSEETISFERQTLDMLWLTKSTYWEVYDPYVCAGPVCGDLVDDVNDIYNDLLHGLTAFDKGDASEAQWIWMWSFENHWKYHAVDAIRAIANLQSQKTFNFDYHGAIPPSDKNKALTMVCELLDERYAKRTFGKNNCYISRQGKPFKVVPFPGCDALCCEYAENFHDAEVGRFEDGDRFFMENYCSFGDFYTAIVREIEDCEQNEKAIPYGYMKCPCCGKAFVRELDICMVCNWQNDLVQYDHPDLVGGANIMSLNEARAAVAAGKPTK